MSQLNVDTRLLRMQNRDRSLHDAAVAHAAWASTSCSAERWSTLRWFSKGMHTSTTSMDL
jgi:hypothetical protein